jgi:hypothetical protein
MIFGAEGCTEVVGCAGAGAPLYLFAPVKGSIYPEDEAGAADVAEAWYLDAPEEV